MKISGQNNPLLRIEKIRPKADEIAKPKYSRKPGSAKFLEISSLASDLAGLQNDIKNIPDVRMERVEQIRQMIEKGEYRIDEEKLAEVLSRYI